MWCKDSAKTWRLLAIAKANFPTSCIQPKRGQGFFSLIETEDRTSSFSSILLGGRHCLSNQLQCSQTQSPWIHSKFVYILNRAHPSQSRAREYPQLMPTITPLLGLYSEIPVRLQRKDEMASNRGGADLTGSLCLVCVVFFF